MAKTRTNIGDHEVVIDMVYIEERSGTPLFWVIYGIFQSLIYNLFAESAMSLDRYDRSILTALQHDGRISNVQLAARVNLSESACLRRVRALEENGADRIGNVWTRSGRIYCSAFIPTVEKHSEAGLRLFPLRLHPLSHNPISIPAWEGYAGSGLRGG